MLETNEVRIAAENNLLITLSPLDAEELTKHFLGSIHRSNSQLPSCDQKTVYLAGDFSRSMPLDLSAAKRVFVIDELSENVPVHSTWDSIRLGQVPLSVHGMGVLYPEFFDPEIDYFQRIQTEHEFQSLTESTKPGVAHRTGIYLTPVTKLGEDLHFRLLRCSSNFSGPTENFRATDSEIVETLNSSADKVFQHHSPMNHVLAQIYHNRRDELKKKETKAKIKAHADKTKDMPANGVMAFCTFYDRSEEREFAEKYLTKLHFRIKQKQPDKPWPNSFAVTLYPGSVFMMPLSTNRYYTHETRPATAAVEKLPTRLGYVVRCSSTPAVHRDGQTYLKLTDQQVPLGEPTQEGMVELRHLYAEENRSESFIDYGNRFLFSMNKGDYQAPEV